MQIGSLQMFVYPLDIPKVVPLKRCHKFERFVSTFKSTLQGGVQGQGHLNLEPLQMCGHPSLESRRICLLVYSGRFTPSRGW